MRLRSNHVLPPISEYVPRRRRTTRSASAAGTDAASETATTVPEAQSAGKRPAPKRKPAKKAGRKKVSSETRCHNSSYLTHFSRRLPPLPNRSLMPPKPPGFRKTPLHSFRRWSNQTPVRCPPSSPKTPRPPRACSEDESLRPSYGEVPANS